jgi:single-strand DNA-binding protein
MSAKRAGGFNTMGTIISINITGFVGSDPQVRTVQTSNGDKQVASFSVAVNRTNGGGQKQTLWVRVNCWGNLAKVAEQYVKRGSLIQATTEWLRPSAWVDQSGSPQASIDIDANRLILLDRVNGDSDQTSEEEQIPF